MKQESKHVKPTSMQAYLCVGITFVIVLGSMVLGLKVHFAMLLASIIATLMAIKLGYKWAEIEEAISHRLGYLAPTLIIMWCIGMLLGCMMFSGTLPLLVYYGFELINPKILYLSSFLVCCALSLLTGSSWTSVSTGGIACMTLAQVFDGNLGLAAGAIISGAIFGDKISPMSETTNLAPACAGTDLWSHIRSQLWTTVPAWVIACIVYTVLGLRENISSTELPEEALVMMNQLKELYSLNIVLLLPVLLLLFLAVRKQPVIPALVICSFLSIVLGVLVQGFDIVAGTNAAISGFTVASIAPEGYEVHSSVSYLLNRGGMISMANVVMICYCGFSMTTIMIRTGILDKAVEPLMKRANSRFKAVLTAEIAIFIVHAIAGISYLSSVFVGESWRKAYIKNGMGLPALSRTLEDVGTTVSAMFPWGQSGAFYAATLGVAAFGPGGYAPYLVLSFCCPIIALILAATGIGVSKLTDEQIVEELAKLEAEETGVPLSEIAM